MILRCPKCESPVDAPDEQGKLVTCNYCETVSRTDGYKLWALKAWDATAEEVQKELSREILGPDGLPLQPLPLQPTKLPEEAAEHPVMRLDKRAWKAPEQKVAAPLFPPADPVAAAREMSHKTSAPEPELPPVPVAEQVRPLLKFGVPAVVAAALLAAGIFAWAKFSEGEGTDEAPPKAATPREPTVDPEVARKAELASAVEAAAKKLSQGGAFEAADVPALVELLSRPDLRLRVAEALASLGAAASSATPALLALLDDPLSGAAALDAASRIAPRSAALRDAIEKVLGGDLKITDSIRVCFAAIAACGRLGEDGARLLGAGLRSPSLEVRDACVQALLKIGPSALPVALSVLQWGGKPDSQDAATAVLQGMENISRSDAPALLSGVGKHPAADRAIFALLRDLGPDVLVVMLEALDAHDERPGEDWWDAAQACMESFGGSAVPILRSWLEENHIERPQVRARLVRAAGSWGRDAVPFIARALADENADVRNAAVESLGQIGPRASEAWEALQNASAQGGLDHRVAAVAVRIRGAEAIPLLVLLLQPTVAPPTRLAAAQELGGLGLAAAPAIPDLIALLPDATLRPVAFTALEKIGDPAVEALLEALRHELPEIRIGAAVTLGKLGPRTSAVTPALLRALEDEVKDVSDASLRALLAMGSEGVLEFEKALKHRNRSVRAVAVWALGQFGPVAAGALPELRAALKEEAEPFRKSVVKTMARMGPRGVAELSDLLKHDHAGIREWSAQALGGMGADAASALPALKTAMQDREPAVQAAAAQAVEKLEKK